MAREYLGEALKTARKTANNADEIQKVKETLIERYKTQAQKDAQQDSQIMEGITKDSEQDQNMISLENRILKLEKQSNFWKWLTGAISVVALAVAIIGLLT
jgi:hypothetical protein